MKIFKRIPKIIFVGLLLILSPDSLMADASDIYWSREGELAADLVRKISPTVMPLTNKSNGKRQTGVIVDSPKGSFILTNYHLLGSTNDVVVAYFTDLKGALEEFPIRFIKGDASLDLALFTAPGAESISRLLSMGYEIKTEKQGVPSRIIRPGGDKEDSLSQKEFASEGDVLPGKNVMFLGFPLGKGLGYIIPQETIHFQGARAKVNLPPQLAFKTPIARFGKVASLPDGRNFFIDAMVNHGNSGSPVFLRTGAKTEGGAQLDYRFCGIIRGFESDNVVFKGENGVEMSLPHNSGLALVISIKAIAEFLSEFK